ncbi:glycoside hydrolase domain-containing protein [Pedobacter aquatilis]|uniref:glycoside hydrolase domain-containing protein n=1 Tax=Pedobacter aquatilis TaxID=351343 RepID=UPI00292E73C2|nr:glycoside hydrolase domain-containing protein [Pedobacter aquatilis]
MILRLAITFILLLNSFFGLAQDPLSGKLQIQNQIISLDKMRFEINADGFPKQYYIVDESLNSKPKALLYEPMHFHFYTSPKTQEKLSITNVKVLYQSVDSVVWVANSASTNLRMNVFAKMLSNGLIKYNIKITALKNIEFSAINFHIPFEKLASKYLLGLGRRKDYFRPDTVRWNESHSNALKPRVWIGNDSLGLYLSVKNSGNWLKENTGSMQINIKGSSMLTDISTGKVVLKQSDELNFDFVLILTPMPGEQRKVSKEKQFKRYEKLERRAANKLK